MGREPEIGRQPPVLPTRLMLHEQDEILEFEKASLGPSYGPVSVALMLIIGFVAVLTILWLLSL